MTPGHLHLLASSLLVAVREIFEEESVDLPRRQYVTQGLEVFDCDQATVSVQRIFAGLPGGETTQPMRGSVYTSGVDFRVQILRRICVVNADGSPPPASKLQSEGEVLLTDMWVLYEGLRSRHARQELFPQCTSATLHPAMPIRHGGGIGGCQCSVVVQL